MKDESRGFFIYYVIFKFWVTDCRVKSKTNGNIEFSNFLAKRYALCTHRNVQHR